MKNIKNQSDNSFNKLMKLCIDKKLLIVTAYYTFFIHFHKVALPGIGIFISTILSAVSSQTLKYVAYNTSTNYHLCDVNINKLISISTQNMSVLQF